jgi:hypothetical protein
MPLCASPFCEKTLLQVPDARSEREKAASCRLAAPRLTLLAEML